MTHVGDRTQPRPEGQGEGPTDAEIDASLDATFGQGGGGTGGGNPPNPPPNPPPPPPGGPGPQPQGQPQPQGPDPRAPQTGGGTAAAPAVTPGQRTPNDWTAGTPAGNLLRSGTQHRAGNLPAEGGPPNGVLFKADEQGRYTNYTVYDEHGRAIKRVDLTGASHGGVPTPHVVLYRHNYAPNGRVSVNAERRVRPARTDEIP
jgi:filamentous hemagglutinin